MTTNTKTFSNNRTGSNNKTGYKKRYMSRRKVCIFCIENIDNIDYKNTGTLKNYITDRYMIESRRRSGVCAKHQRRLAKAIKRARNLAILPISPNHSLGSYN